MKPFNKLLNYVFTITLLLHVYMNFSLKTIYFRSKASDFTLIESPVFKNKKNTYS